MKYDDIKDKCFATGSIPDGYFGDRRNVGFYFDNASGKTFCVADCGYFLSSIPQAIDDREALWLLINHPSARNITVN